MFTVDNKYKNEEVNSSSVIKRSGLYVMKCTKAKIFKSQRSSSECLNLTFEDENGQKAWFGLWYKNKDGEDVEFVTRFINHFMGLTGINERNLNWDKDGNVVSFLNKYTGIVLEVGKIIDQKGKEQYDYQLKCFYDFKTKKTLKEITENTQPEVIKKFEEKYKDSQDVVLRNFSTGDRNNNSNDGYKDMGMTETFDTDLPF